MGKKTSIKQEPSKEVDIVVSSLSTKTIVFSPEASVIRQETLEQSRPKKTKS